MARQEAANLPPLDKNYRHVIYSAKITFYVLQGYYDHIVDSSVLLMSLQL